jgi:predicted ATPase
LKHQFVEGRFPLSTPFVDREQELTRLQDYLDKALDGNRQICYISGEAGAGKTRLVNEFALRAQEKNENLVVAIGTCDPQTGQGTPYLPFIEVLNQLTGDIEAKLAQGEITQENANRLSNILIASGEVLVEAGPDLINLFVPGASLATLIGKLVIQKTGWQDKLRKRSDAKTVPEQVNTELDKDKIYEQYINVLGKLSEKVPLIVVLDDLQWADESSLQLLFRISRRIENSRLLVIGTYRPNDIAMGRNGERHPIEPVLTEMKRYLGDITIDLDVANEKNGKLFIEEYLRVSDVNVDSDFIEKMYSITEGHPLFVVELLDVLQTRGELVQDVDGHWQLSGIEVDWSQLPARIDGVIEERVGRLSSDQLELLKGASVEGKSFTAEIIAKLLSKDSRELIREISGDLQRRHRLVEAEGVARLGRQRISNYRFSNKMVQAYLYSSMDEVEASFMHEEIGYALEELYGESADNIAVRLAWHFEMAQIPDKARYYLQKAGEQASAKHADRDALNYLSKALEMTPEEEIETRFDILYNRQSVFDRQGNREAQWIDFDALESIGKKLDDPEKQAKTALHKSEYFLQTDNYESGLESANKVINLAHSLGDSELEAKGRLTKASLLNRMDRYDESIDILEQGLLLSRKANDTLTEAKTLYAIATITTHQGRIEEAEKLLNEVLEIALDLNNDFIITPLNGLAYIYDKKGEYEKTYEQSIKALKIAREYGVKSSEGILLNNLGANQIKLGDFDSATEYLNKSIDLNKKIQSELIQTLSTLLLGDIAWKRGEPETGKTYYDEALEVTQRIGSNYWKAYALTGIGNVLTDMGEYDEAEKVLKEAIEIREEMGNQLLVFDPLSGLAKLHNLNGSPQEALEVCKPILTHLEEGNDLFGAWFPIFIYHTLYKVLEENNDPRYVDILKQVNDWLNEKADLMTEATRKMFLENPIWKQELLNAHQNNG